jgi:hypothetical protein
MKFNTWKDRPVGYARSDTDLDYTTQTSSHEIFGIRGSTGTPWMAGGVIDDYGNFITPLPKGIGYPYF